MDERGRSHQGKTRTRLLTAELHRCTAAEHTSLPRKWAARQLKHCSKAPPAGEAVALRARRTPCNGAHVVAVIHSRPTTPYHPSPAHLMSCRAACGGLIRWMLDLHSGKHGLPRLLHSRLHILLHCHGTSTGVFQPHIHAVLARLLADGNAILSDSP